MSKAMVQENNQEPKAPLRDRVWKTAFEWAKDDLGTNKKTARQIADAAVEDLDNKPATK